MQIVTVSTEELARIVEESVEHALASHERAEGWLDSAGAAEHLSTTVGSLHVMRRQGLIPAYRPEGTSRWLFKASELDAFVRGANA